MNLGSFVGSAVDSYRTAERTKADQEDRATNSNLRERAMVQQEQQGARAQEEADARTQDRDRKQIMREESAAAMQQYYGDQDVEVEDGMGGSTVTKQRIIPGQDPKRDLAAYRDVLAIQVKHSGMTADDIKKAADHFEEAAKTEGGKLLDRVLSGDESAIAEFAKKSGRDPNGAKLEQRPFEGVNQITFADGKPIDLRQWAARFTKGKWAAEQRAQENHQLGIESKKAETNLRTAQTKTEGAKQGNYAAQANRANRAGAPGAGGFNDKESKALLAAVKLNTAPDPNGDGKTKDAAMTQYIYGSAVRARASNPKMTVDQAVAASVGQWTKDVEAIKASLRSKSKEQKKKEYPGESDAQIISSAMLWKANQLPSSAADQTESDPE